MRLSFFTIKDKKHLMGNQKPFYDFVALASLTEPLEV